MVKMCAYHEIMYGRPFANCEDCQLEGRVRHSSEG